jgi:phosphate/sulfate permease
VELGFAIALSAVFNMLGALPVGSAVADTIAGIVTVSPAQTVTVIGEPRPESTRSAGVAWKG